VHRRTLGSLPCAGASAMAQSQPRSRPNQRPRRAPAGAFSTARPTSLAMTSSRACVPLKLIKQWTVGPCSELLYTAGLQEEQQSLIMSTLAVDTAGSVAAAGVVRTESRSVSAARLPERPTPGQGTYSSRKCRARRTCSPWCFTARTKTPASRRPSTRFSAPCAHRATFQSPAGICAASLEPMFDAGRRGCRRSDHQRRVQQVLPAGTSVQKEGPRCKALSKLPPAKQQHTSR